MAIEFHRLSLAQSVSCRLKIFLVDFISCWSEGKLDFLSAKFIFLAKWMSTFWFPLRNSIFGKENSIYWKCRLTWFSTRNSIIKQFSSTFPPTDCEKSSTNDQLYDSNTNTTTSSTDLSDFISNSNTTTSGNTTTTNTISSSNNSSNNSNQLNGQDSFPAGGEYKHFTSVLLTQEHSIVGWIERWRIIQIKTVKSNCRAWQKKMSTNATQESKMTRISQFVAFACGVREPICGLKLDSI